MEAARPGGPFAGRQAELAAVVSYAGDAEVAGVLFAGGHGSGKTELLRRAAATLAALGWRIERVAGSRSAASVPFGAVAHLLPAEWRGDGPPVWVLRAVEERMRGGRAALCVDDAHLLDDASAAVIGHLAASRAAFVVLAADTGGPVPDALGVFRRWELPALPAVDIDRLIDHALDGELDGVTRGRLRRSAGGNPLALQEAIRGGLANGSIRRRYGVWTWDADGEERGGPVGAGVAERLRRLAPAVRQVLELVAAGEPVPLAVLERAADAATIRSAEDDGLIAVERAGAPAGVRLAHPVFAVALRTGRSILRARWAYRSLVEAARGLPAGGLDDPLRFGCWQVAADLIVDPGAVADGAREALRRGDLRTAERLARAVRDRVPGPDADRLLARVLCARGRAAEAVAVLGRPAPAEPGCAVTGAVARYWSTGDRAAAIAMLPVRVDSVHVDWGRVDSVRVDSVHDDSDRVDSDRVDSDRVDSDRVDSDRVDSVHVDSDRVDSDRVDWDRVDSVRAAILLADGACVEADALAGRVLDRPGTGNELAAAVVAVAAGFLGRGAEVPRARPRSTAFARTAGGAGWLGFAAGLGHLAAGELRVAADRSAGGYRAAVEAGAAVPAGGWAALRGLTAATQGRFGVAAPALREAAALLDEDDMTGVVRLCLTCLGAIAALTGDGPAGLAWLQRAERRPGHRARLFEPWVQQWRAWAFAATRSAAAAVPIAANAARLARDAGLPAVEAAALFDVVRLGGCAPGLAAPAKDQPTPAKDPATPAKDQAAPAKELATPAKDLAALAKELAALAKGLATPAAGAMALAAAGLRDGDGDALARAAARFTGLGYELLAAECAAAAWRAHRRFGRRGTAQAYAETAALLRARCGGARTPLLDLDGVTEVLTPREREVLLLAVDHTSPQIAGRLGLSPRTVTNNLARAYAKLGVSGRPGLRALLGREAVRAPVRRADRSAQ